MELIDLIRKFLLNYKYVNKENFANNDIIKLISKEIPNNLYHKLENKNLLKVEGSGGKDNQLKFLGYVYLVKK